MVEFEGRCFIGKLKGEEGRKGGCEVSNKGVCKWKEWSAGWREVME